MSVHVRDDVREDVRDDVRDDFCEILCIQAFQVSDVRDGDIFQI